MKYYKFVQFFLHEYYSVNWLLCRLFNSIDIKLHNYLILSSRKPIPKKLAEKYVYICFYFILLFPACCVAHVWSLYNLSVSISKFLKWPVQIMWITLLWMTDFWIEEKHTFCWKQNWNSMYCYTGMFQARRLEQVTLFVVVKLCVKW